MSSATNRCSAEDRNRGKEKERLDGEYEELVRQVEPYLLKYWMGYYRARVQFDLDDPEHREALERHLNRLSHLGQGLYDESDGTKCDDTG